MIKSLLILLSIGIPLSSYAFDKKKCSDSFWKMDGHSFEARGISRFFNHITSTGQYTSSTGECSSLADKKDDKAKRFYFANADKILDELSRGRGEFLNTFLTEMKCDAASKERILIQRINMRKIIMMDRKNQYQFFKKHSTKTPS